MSVTVFSVALSMYFSPRHGMNTFFPFGGTPVFTGFLQIAHNTGVPPWNLVTESKLGTE